MHPAVALLFYEVRVRTEGIFPAVLKNEVAARVEYVPFQYLVGNILQTFEGIRRICKNNVELPIDTHSEGFKLITRVQDEAHRFAIEYHRSLRKKDQVHSVLDDIPGIGPKRRRALMRSFSHIDDIRNAGVEELMQKGEMPRNAAESIYAYFHKADTI